MGAKGGPTVKVTFKDLVYADHSGTGCHYLHLFLMSEGNMKVPEMAHSLLGQPQGVSSG